MEALYRCVSGLAAGAAALFAPIGPMAATTAAFIGIDFLTAIAMAWLIDRCVLGFTRLDTARLFAGFICGVEMWSFLENAAQLSDAPLFRRLRRYARRRIGKEAGR